MKNSKELKKHLMRERVSYLMLLPNLVMFGVFTVYPIL